MGQRQPAFQVGDAVLYGTQEAVIADIDDTYTPTSYTLRFQDGRERNTIAERFALLENNSSRGSAHEEAINPHLNGDSPISHQSSVIGMSSAELIYAASEGCRDTVESLITCLGADVHARDVHGRTPLAWAALRGHTETVDLLVTYGAEVIDHDWRGISPLSYASRNGHTGIIDSLISKYHVDVDLPDLDLMTPLMHAAQTSCTETFIHLIEKHGANVEAVDLNGRTPFVYAEASGSQENMHALVSSPDNPDRVSASVDAEDHMNTEYSIPDAVTRVRDLFQARNDMNAALIEASTSDDADRVRALIQSGADVNAPDDSGWTALIHASRYSDVARIRTLIEAGADVDAGDNLGWTALIHVSRSGDVARVRALIDAGARVNANDNIGWTALIHASRYGDDDRVRALIDAGADVNTALIEASASGDADRVCALVEAWSDVDGHGNSGLTALMVASKYGDIDLVRALIQSGADVNARDNTGLTALIHASKYGDVARVLTLIEAGAHVDSRDNCGWTALLHASKYGDVDRVQALVEAGADVSARNNEDRCALSIAMEREHSEIVAYLESVEFQSHFGSFGFSEHEDMEIARSSAEFQDDENMFDSAADARYQTHSNYPDVDSSHITLGRELGQGSYAIVHEGTWHGVKIAVKRIRPPHGESWCSESQDLLRQVFEDQVRPEVDIMSAIKHPFVVGCYGCYVDPPSILLELCPRGSLSQMLQTCREDEGLRLLMSWHQRLCMLRQVASAMKYLHSKNVFHRDLRAMNVLVAQDMTTKVSDVGLGKFVDEVSTRSAGTLGEGANPRWLAPELVSDDRPFTRACDVYGFGTIMWEMMEWRLPWEGMSSLQIIRAMVQGRGLEVAGQDRWHSLPGPAPQHPDTFSGISSLATQCLNPDPSIRPSFEDIVQILLQFEEQEPREELCNVGSPRAAQSAQNNGSLDALNRLPTCCVCLDPNANTIMSGCGHLCLCQDCSDSAQVSTCPICRAPGTPQRIYLV